LFFVPPVELEQEIRELTKQKAEQQSALDEWKVGIVKLCGRSKKIVFNVMIFSSENHGLTIKFRNRKINGF